MRQRLAEIRARIEAACDRAGRNPADVRLLAVSKTQPLELLEEAYALGIRDFGENYVQELLEKRRALASLQGIRWHLIGHLQSNKAKLAVANADVFHALDSARLAHELGKRLAGAGLAAWPVYIEVNVDAQQSKAGVAPSELPALVEAVRAESALRLEGLMCIPEPKENPEAMRPAFRRLAELARSSGIDRARLSMGMSDDFEIAVEEGAHWVRVGRLLFGERKTQ